MCSDFDFLLKRYYELDLHKSLLDNLRNKVIIEYPTFHVVLKGSSNDMKILQQGRHKFVSAVLKISRESEAFVRLTLHLFVCFSLMFSLFYS